MAVVMVEGVQKPRATRVAVSDGAMDSRTSSRPSAAAVRTAAGVLLVCVGYFVGGLVGFIAPFPGSGISTIWSATAILLAVLLLSALAYERLHAMSALRRNEAALQASNEQVRDLAGRLIAAQEAERTRIARDLHDDVNQRIAALAIALSGLKRRLPETAGDVRDELARLHQRIVELAGTVRHLSHELHPGVLQHAGLTAALEAHCAEFGSQHALGLTFQADDNLGDVPPDAALCLYRVAQEALQNVVQHASARRAHVTLARDADDLELTVTDDGQGFDLEEARRANGLGLISLDERARLVGGSVRIDTRPQWGTELRVRVPLGGLNHGPRAVALG
jgi:two-component system sensor histidine kinase UhpB